MFLSSFNMTVNNTSHDNRFTDSYDPIPLQHNTCLSCAIYQFVCLKDNGASCAKDSLKVLTELIQKEAAYLLIIQNMLKTTG